MIPTDSPLVIRSATQPLASSRSLSAWLLRQRFLLALSGIALSMGCHGGTPGYGYGYSYGSSCGEVTLAEAATATLVDPEQDCPDDPSDAPEGTFKPPPMDSTVLSALDLPDCTELSPYSYAEILESSLNLASQSDEGLCAYELTCVFTQYCYEGRPLRREGEPLLASAVPRADWQAQLSPELGGLTASQRSQLAAHWLSAAAEEHSSVAGFQQAALDLLAHGAPPELVQRALEAAIQEIGHARTAYALASAYAGEPRGPGPLDLGRSVPVADSLVSLAVSVARQGAIGETLAAWIAAARLERTTDPAVRQALQTVVTEETLHAELAWQTLQWAIERGGPQVRDAVRGAFTELVDDPVRGCDDAVLSGHGQLSDEELRAAARQCLDEVIAPVARTLLSDRLAA